MQLSDINIGSFEVSLHWKGQLAEVMQKYNMVFSSDKLNCSKAKDFQHHIYVIEKRLFHLPHWTVKDAHLVTPQVDCLTALGENTIFNATYLIFGYYGIPVHEEDKKLTVLTTPVGLHQFNRVPHGLCNGPSDFTQQMINIFGDQKLFHYCDVLRAHWSLPQIIQRPSGGWSYSAEGVWVSVTPREVQFSCSKVLGAWVMSLMRGG